MNGQWSDWSIGTVCSVTCGSGVTTNSRACDDPPPAGGGADCAGNATEEIACDMGTCPRKATRTHFL